MLSMGPVSPSKLALLKVKKQLLHMVGGKISSVSVSTRMPYTLAKTDLLGSKILL